MVDEEWGWDWISKTFGCGAYHTLVY